MTDQRTTHQTEFSDAELEARLVYAAIVAGKSAKFTDAVMARMERFREGDESPLRMCARLHACGLLLQMLIDCRSGNYRKLEKCLWALSTAKLNLRTCTPEQLETIHGIGPKTSRFFILWTRPHESYAALDVHVLRWLKAQGHNAPKSTPSGAKYRKLELAFLAEAKARGMTARELDHQIWNEGARYE